MNKYTATSNWSELLVGFKPYIKGYFKKINVLILNLPYKFALCFACTKIQN